MTSTCCFCEAEAKYRCPGCDRRTCSLDCVERHKAKWQCNGKRSRTHFTSIGDFTERDMISDLRLLEDVKRVKEANWRKLRRVALVLRPQETPSHQRKLRYEARQRGMRLEYLPRGMSRSKSNSSWFDYRRGEICWDIDWMLPFFQDRPVLHKRRVPETETVSKALSIALDTARIRRSEEDRFSVVMKKLGCPANEVLHFDLDLEATLRSQLEGKDLVEYPVLIVLREGDRSKYNIQQRL